MNRRVSFCCPVDLEQLDGLAPLERDAMLRFLQCDGVRRISIVARGGDRRPLWPDDDEAMFVEPGTGPYRCPPEERIGRGVSGCISRIY